MPLSHSQNFEGFGSYGNYGRPNIHSQCQKRKMDIIEGAPSEEMPGNCDIKTDHHESIPKRQCQWVSSECQVFEFHQNGNHGDDVNMEEDRAIEAENQRHASSDQALSLSSCCQLQDRGVFGSSMSMDADSVPAAESHIQSHTTRSVSTPQNITQEPVRRGLKPSPVSGRLFCHCSASWRGMYGLDMGYITDYY